MNVLIIDDDPVSVAIIRDHVSSIRDCAVLPFTSSLCALEWCKNHEPDLVMIDYMMPPPNGMEFIDLFRTLPGKAEIPLVMITGDCARGIRYEALEKGVNDFLCKPFDSTEFIARIRNMISLRTKQKELEERASQLDREVRVATAKIALQERETILLLTRATELRDPETWIHLQRMSYYSQSIAKNLQLSKPEQELIFNAAPLHDIGKVGIPDEILLKEEALNEVEFAAIKNHTILGHRILKDSDSPILRMGAEIALTHHEKFDGTGYPQGLSGDNIPLCGRIAAVADVFDALTSLRPYKKPWAMEHAAAEIRNHSGHHFDPAIVEAFQQGWDEILGIQRRFQD